uniref:Serpin B6 n=1 Tax=Myripristis murdjan TaxID=586833 RepID=A0A667WGM7_9TELE
MAASSPLSEANTAFCLALFKQLDEDKKSSNVFYSPLSISSALAMVMLGARANTATQILHRSPVPALTLICFDCPQCLKAQDDVHVKFSKLIKELNKAGAPYSLSLANRLYGDQSYQFVEGFLADTKKHYDAKLKSVDFKASAETARININNWVEKQTQDKIKDLLAPGVVDSMTRLVLVNAIYFKGNWDRKFDADLTKDAQFKLNKVTLHNINTGALLKTFYDTVVASILELPYKGKDLSMLIFLPYEMEDDTTGLEKLEKELTYEKFVEWTQPHKMYTVEVDVGLPRFKMEESYNLKDILTRMGMVDAFDVRMSDFSGMSPANDLVLSQVVHKAFVEVNEEGTKAAAATTSDIMLCCGIPTFIADHPFLFFIRHKPSMSVLFAGRFCSPA